MTEEVCVSGVAASIFVDILATLERIGDHIHNITKQTDMNYTNTIQTNKKADTFCFFIKYIIFVLEFL